MTDNRLSCVYRQESLARRTSAKRIRLFGFNSFGIKIAIEIEIVLLKSNDDKSTIQSFRDHADHVLDHRLGQSVLACAKNQSDKMIILGKIIQKFIVGSKM